LKYHSTYATIDCGTFGPSAPDAPPVGAPPSARAPEGSEPGEGSGDSVDADGGGSFLQRRLVLRDDDEASNNSAGMSRPASILNDLNALGLAEWQLSARDERDSGGVPETPSPDASVEGGALFARLAACAAADGARAESSASNSTRTSPGSSLAGGCAWVSPGDSVKGGAYFASPGPSVSGGTIFAPRNSSPSAEHASGTGYCFAIGEAAAAPLSSLAVPLDNSPPPTRSNSSSTSPPPATRSPSSSSSSPRSRYHGTPRFPLFARALHSEDRAPIRSGGVGSH
jgi:hypothetical protein